MYLRMGEYDEMELGLIASCAKEKILVGFELIRIVDSYLSRKTSTT